MPEGRFVLLDAASRPDIDPRVLEALGGSAWEEGDTATARERWEAALAVGSSNAAVMHHLAHLEARHWFRQFDPYFRLAPETAERLRGYLLRSIDSAPSQAAAYELLAWVESAAPEPSIRHVSMVQEKFDLLDDRSQTYLALTLIRARLRDYDACSDMLEFLTTSDPSAGMQRSVRLLRTYVDIQRALEKGPP